MTRRGRITSFSSAGLLVGAGIVCAILAGGITGALLGFILISLGLALAVSLVFLEVGLSEDRDRDRRRAAAKRSAARRRPRSGPPRMRSHRDDLG